MSVGSETRCQVDVEADVDEVDCDAAEQALMVLLQHPSILHEDHRVACKLLCTSKQLGELLLAAHGGGAMELRCDLSTTEQADALGAWLSRHGGLLCSLELPYLFGDCSHDAHVRLLACIPDGITRLVLEHFQCDEKALAQEATVLAHVLSRQQSTRLRSLALPDWNCWGAAEAARMMQPLLPAVAALTGLTSLRLSWPQEGRSWADDDDEIMAQVEYGRAWAQQLPAQLQELELTRGPEWSSAASEWLALERLPELTRLKICDTTINGGVLPRTVRSLEVCKCKQGAPWLATLQGLPQLTQLVFDHEGIATHELQQLSSLSSLRAVQLIIAPNYFAFEENHDEHGRLDGAASSLGTFPLVYLHAYNQMLTPEVLSGLGRCTGLTLYSAWLERATVQQLADCAVRLSELVTLSIQCSDDKEICAGCVDCAGGADAGEQCVGWSALAEAVGRLPVLRSCGFWGLPLGSAAALLGAATQLTELQLGECGVDDSIVAGLCGSLRGLRELDLYSGGITDACLPAIAAGLRQLTLLQLSRAGSGGDGGVTDAGVQQLLAVLPGLKVELNDLYKKSESEVDGAEEASESEMHGD